MGYCPHPIQRSALKSNRISSKPHWPENIFRCVSISVSFSFSVRSSTRLQQLARVPKFVCELDSKSDGSVSLVDFRLTIQRIHGVLITVQDAANKLNHITKT